MVCSHNGSYSVTTVWKPEFNWLIARMIFTFMYNIQYITRNCQTFLFKTDQF